MLLLYCAVYYFIGRCISLFTLQNYTKKMICANFGVSKYFFTLLIFFFFVYLALKYVVRKGERQ